MVAQAAGVKALRDKRRTQGVHLDQWRHLTGVTPWASKPIPSDSVIVARELLPSEAIELAKKFGAEQSGAFVNGILDALAREVGLAEV